jgi:hypothetical protein
MRPLLSGILGALLSGCTLIGLGPDVPHQVSGGDVYTGDGAVTLTVTTEQVGCCYVEGSLRFARLEGPSTFDWAVDDGSAADDWDGQGAYLVGRQTSSIEPGDYRLTGWEQVCSGNCQNLDRASNECSLAFSAEPDATIEILVSYTIPDPCIATVADGTQ